MNKSDLIDVVADKAAISKDQARAAIDAIFESIALSLKRDDDVRLIGFGTFTATRRGASKGRNPATGAEINIPASVRPTFKPGKVLKDAVISSGDDDDDGRGGARFAP